MTSESSESPEPGGPEQNKPVVKQRRGWWIAAGLVVLLLVVGLVMLWIKAPALYGQGDAAKTAAATTRGAILTVAAALIAATAAGAGVYMTARTIRINQQALAETQRANQQTLAETQRANREADQRDRYTKAIDQLGSEMLDVRLGGIYGLERIAKTSEQDHPTVVEVLSAFAREHSQSTTGRMLLPIERSRMQTAEPHPSGAQQDRASMPKPATDVQAAVSVLGRLPSRPGVSRGDLTSAHLTRAILVGANLAGADLDGANLTGANLYRADLTGASLQRADLTSADLTGADLTSADLSWADLRGVFFLRAALTDAKRSGEPLTPARLKAVLATIRVLTQEQLNSAQGNNETKLPAGLQRPAHWSADRATPQADQ